MQLSDWQKKGDVRGRTPSHWRMQKSLKVGRSRREEEERGTVDHWEEKRGDCPRRAEVEENGSIGHGQR